MNYIIRIDMSTLSVTKEETPEELKVLGGRFVTSKLIAKEVPATCNPIGPDNKLIIAPGLVAGSIAPSSGRVSVGAKSPLTGGIKEANAGTPVAHALGKLGVKALVIENAPKNKTDRNVVYIDKDGVKFEVMNDLRLRRTSDTVRYLKEIYGNKVKIICNGPAGELRQCSAGICFVDTDGKAVRYAARGGVGAVMGSKGVKAIVINDEGMGMVQPRDKKKFQEGIRGFVAGLGEDEATKKGGALNAGGTPGTVQVMSEGFKGLPTRNFSQGKWAYDDDINGPKEAELVEKRGRGKMGHACNPGCVIRCSNIFPHKDGRNVASVEYESIGLLGSNLNISDFDDIADLIDECNEVGVDTIEIGAALGVLMESEYIQFGDAKNAKQIIKEIGLGTPIGRIVGSGTETVGRVFGQYRVPTVKGQGLPAYDPRAVKGIGFTYATSPMGADHTAGYTINREVFAYKGQLDPLSYEGKAEYSKAEQLESAFLDGSGFCLFTVFGYIANSNARDEMLKTLTAFTGVEMRAENYLDYGQEIIDSELDFNRRAGISSVSDMLPEFFYKEKLPELGETFEATNEMLLETWGK